MAAPDHGWPMLPLGLLVENFDSVRVPVRETDRRPGPYPYYGASGVVDYVDGYLFDGDYLLIAEDGENLRTQQTPVAFMATGRFWVNNHAHIVRGRGANVTRYLMYAVRSADIHAFLTGSTMPKLTKENLGRIPVVSPPPAAQQAIAGVLGALDDKIELNRRMNRTLEELASALFKSWFVDFDPVQAKIDGRRPVGVPEHVLPLFPAHFEDSELGPIPKGWRVRPLDSIADFLNGLALQKYPPGDGGDLPVIKIAQLRAGTVEGADRASADLPSEYIVQDGDVIFSWSGSLLVDVWCTGPGALNQHLFKVTSAEFPKWFFLHWVREHLAEFQGIAADKATTMGHIRRHHLTDALVVVPDERLLEGLSTVQAPLLDKLIADRLENRTLAQLRDTLLPALLSGEVTIKQAEKAVGEVA